MGINAIGLVAAAVLFSSAWLSATRAFSQTPPSAGEIAAYDGLHVAAHRNDAAVVQRALASGAAADARDSARRTAVHVAAYASAYDALRALAAGGADIRAMDSQRYDVITIAAVNNDVRMVKLAVQLGGDPKAITSPYDGTALIAAAHLGHVEMVKALIEAGAPLDHINNLGWTALIEAIVLGDGGRRHIETVRVLVEAGANKSIADRDGRIPVELAEARGYAETTAILK